MPRTILSELSSQNPILNASRASPGGTTHHSDWPAAESWTLWEDFNATQCYQLFEEIMNAEWQDPTADVDLTTFDLEIYDEDSFEHSVLSRKLYPSVNAALQRAMELLDISEGINLCRGGRTYYNPSGATGHRPDWALCSRLHMTDTLAYYNLLPGDTKLSVKWSSDLFPDYLAYWENPVRQILHYCDMSRVRYGYIITDQELVVMRCTREAIGTPEMTRSGRGQPIPPGHYRQLSSDSDNSEEPVQSSPPKSSYQQTESGGEFCPVEYQVIPWSNHGDGQLTVRLGLFYLSMMAGYGRTTIQTEYPLFDSWYYRNDGVYVHNTTGRLCKERPHQAVLRYFKPSAGPEWVNVDDVQYLTLASVRTLQIDEDGFYFYIQEQGRVRIDDQQLIYDQENQTIGRIYGLEWQVERGEPSQKRRKET
ncbi:hypothetical protein ACHAQJ_009120 [Trichoderma viride]